jgi:hypothetical protein
MRISESGVRDEKKREQKNAKSAKDKARGACLPLRPSANGQELTVSGR